MNPLFNTEVATTGRIDYALVTPEHIAEALDKFLDEAMNEHIAEMQNPNISYKGIFDKEYTKSGHLSAIWNVVHTLQGVKDSEELQNLYEKYVGLVQEYSFLVNQKDTRPYDNLKTFMDSDEYKNLDPLRKRYVDKSYESYVKSGIELPIDKKEQLKIVQENLSKLTNQFSNNLKESEKEKRWVFQIDQLDGLSELSLSIAKDLAVRNGIDGYLFTMEDGNYTDILTYSDNNDARKTVYDGCDRCKEGEFDNTKIIHEIAVLKQEVAKIKGFNNYAELSVDDKMAKSPEQVIDFLNDLGNKAIFAAKDERKIIDQWGAKFFRGQEVQFWDRRYITTKYEKEKYSIDYQEVQKYFVFDKVKEGLFQTCEQLFGVTFKDSIAAGTSTVNEKWHDDVQIYDVYEHGKFIGILQTDWWKRASKSGGAWMNPHATYHKTEEGKEYTSITHVVCNFVKSPAGEVQTVEFDDVITMFHEFGHALHNMLSKVEVSGLGGINVEWDGVELPSQFMENFCWNYDHLVKMTAHKETGEPLPHELFEKMYNAKNFNAATNMIRQVVLSEMDMLCYKQDADVRDPMVIEQEIRNKWSTGKLDPDAGMIHVFGHIWGGGYAAGYYSYKWAEVLSADAYAAVKDIPSLITSYKHEILEAGYSRDLMDSFVAFMGREPTVDALLEDCGLLYNDED